MVNVYVHLDIDGLLSGTIDDAFLESLRVELPDASVSVGAGQPLGLTLSQFALTDRVAARRQTARVRQALTAVGQTSATVRVAKMVRGDIRDDLAVVTGALRWHVDRLAERLHAR